MKSHSATAEDIREFAFMNIFLFYFCLIFVADIKIIFAYNLVASLNITKHEVK